MARTKDILESLVEGLDVGDALDMLLQEQDGPPSEEPKKVGLVRRAARAANRHKGKLGTIATLAVGGRKLVQYHKGAIKDAEGRGERVAKQAQGKEHEDRLTSHLFDRFKQYPDAEKVARAAARDILTGKKQGTKQ